MASLSALRAESMAPNSSSIDEDRPASAYSVSWARTRAINFVLEDTVDHRVQEILEAKLAVILEEFGVDKTGDVLDSAQAGQMFDALYMEAILHPETWTAKATSVVSQVQEQARATRKHVAVLGAAETLILPQPSG